MTALALRRVSGRCVTVAALSVVVAPMAAGMVFAMMSIFTMMPVLLMTVMVAVVFMVNHWRVVVVRMHHDRHM